MTEAYYQDDAVVIYHADCREVLSELPDNSIDLVCTDPPYGIGFMGKDWDKALPNKQIWSECLRVLKDGAFAFVMSIPRADCLSRMIISLEDAGFLVGFTPIFWAYASGFPKAQNIGKAVDKRLGAEREKILKPIAYPDSNCWGIPNKNSRGNQWGIVQADDKGRGKGLGTKGMIEDSLASSPQAKALDGSYGGFQPKPAVEVIIVAMKPLSEKTFVDQALKNQKGITWLDEGRIPYNLDSDPNKRGWQGGNATNSLSVFGNAGKERVSFPKSGRFPANLIVNDDVLNDGRITNNARPNLDGKTYQRKGGNQVLPGLPTTRNDPKDSGSFSRYFDLDKWWEERIKQLPASVQKTFPFLIVPKASKNEKNKGLDYSPSSMVGRDEGQDIRNVPQKARSTPRINQHPTVKPLKLMSYLITLGSREKDLVLDPFMGSGSTLVAARQLGFKAIGVDTEEKYCEIAAKRCSQSVRLI